jgi:hypothetical protein
MRSFVVTLSLVAIGLGACSARPLPLDRSTTPVPQEIVPAKLAAENLTLQVNDEPENVAVFKNAGPRSLIGDGRIWELRSGERLVGTLQLSSLRSRVNPARPQDRRALLRILPGATEKIDIAGQPVWAEEGGGKAIFVFFGARSLGVLQLKSSGVSLSAVPDELIGAIVREPLWDALPPEAFEELPEE